MTELGFAGPAEQRFILFVRPVVPSWKRQPVLRWVRRIGLSPRFMAARDEERGPYPPAYRQKILLSKAALEGERKQLSVLFADLKGSTEHVVNLGPRPRAPASRPRSPADDGGCVPLRRHGQPGNGRRYYGAFRSTARA